MKFKNKTVLFYSSIINIELFGITGFYKTDIDILIELGYNVITTNKIFDFLKFWKYDIAFIYFYRWGLFPALIARTFSKKAIFTGGIDALDKDFMNNSNAYFIQKWFCKLCNIFSNANIIVSTTDEKNIKKISSKVENNFLIPHVIDFENYKYDFRNKKNIITSIVWMGSTSNVKRKGVDKLLYTFDNFCKLNNNFELIIIGTKGEGTVFLNKILENLDCKKKVKFLGSIDEVVKIEILKKSKYYFQISEYEGFGIAAIEALAAGNIVFHSGKGGLKDAIGQNGVLIEDTLNFYENAIKLDKMDNEYYNKKSFIDEGISYVEYNFNYEVRKSGIKKVLNSIEIHHV